MHDALVLADSAGHTMIDIEATHAADRAARPDREPDEEDKLREEPGSRRSRRPMRRSAGSLD